MTRGIGVDLVVVEEFRKAAERTPGLLARTFAPSEIAYCERQADPWPHLAGRYAAKEAVMKALGTGWSAGVHFIDIVVGNEDSGQPVVALSGRTAELCQAPATVLLSISHSGGMAIAFAMIGLASR